VTESLHPDLLLVSKVHFLLSYKRVMHCGERRWEKYGNGVCGSKGETSVVTR
jgi:hypothetical protein